MNIPYVAHKNFISLVIDNVPYNVNSSHKNFDIILQKLRNEDYNDIIRLIDDKAAIETQISNENVDLEIKGNNILYKGKALHNSLVNQIIDTKDQGFKFDNLMKFLENLLENTSYAVVNELYDWMESSGSISITDDGAFLAYKKVRSNYNDIYSDTLSNKVGETLEMDRKDVNDDRHNTCSDGLHFCSYEYLHKFGSSSPDDVKVVIVKIFPQDVVSIPSDYSYQKGRCCKYEVVGEVDNYVESGHCLTSTISDYEEDDHVYIQPCDNNTCEDCGLEHCECEGIVCDYCEDTECDGTCCDNIFDDDELEATETNIPTLMKGFTIEDMVKLVNEYQKVKNDREWGRFRSRRRAFEQLEKLFDEDFEVMMNLYNSFM